MILVGMQESNYPISYDEQDNILKEYISVIYDIKKEENKFLIENKPAAKRERKKGKYFIGPSSISLEIKHITKNPSGVVNINSPYAVTDKADGERKLLFINENGKLYLIDLNMRVQFTGCIIKDKKSFNTILDGELVTHNKYNQYYTNLYLHI